jgi:hypothetical protein
MKVEEGKLLPLLLTFVMRTIGIVVLSEMCCTYSGKRVSVQNIVCTNNSSPQAWHEHLLAMTDELKARD